MKLNLALAAALFLIAVVPSHSVALPPTADGITAKIFGGIGGAVYQKDINGDYQVQVTIYENSTTGWHQVAVYATLRVFVFNATSQVDVDVLSLGFTSKAAGPQTVRFPASAIGTNFADVFVTFSSLGGDPVPTSHYNLARNNVIDRAQFGAADLMDREGTQRPFFLG